MTTPAKICALVVFSGLTVLGLGMRQSQNAGRIEFVRVSPGEFMMGCSSGDTACEEDENPRHRVQITRGFEIGKYEVTQAQWTAVMQDNPSGAKGNNLPVETVSKFEALDFLAKLNAMNDGYRYRLPTEAEWEYAARAGSDSANTGSIDQVAWYAGNSEDESHPVGQKKPNAWGLYDMQGNVREWVSDLYSGTYYAVSPVADPQGPEPCPNGVVDSAQRGQFGPRGFGGPNGPPPGGPGFRGRGGPAGLPPPQPPNQRPATQQEQIDELRRQVQDLQQQVQQLRNQIQGGPLRGGRGGFPGPGGPIDPAARVVAGPSVCINAPDGRGGQVQLVDPLDGLPTGLPVVRGGGWDQSAPYLRVSARYTYYGPTLRLSDIGFRVVREPVTAGR